MTIGKDLSDIGYLLITPNPKKFRFEGVNYNRAAKQVMFGGFALQLATIGFVFYGPVICEKVVDVKDNLKRRYHAHKK